MSDIESVESSSVLPHQKIQSAFAEGWSAELSTDDIGKLLFRLGICLGTVIAELTKRGVHWEVIDRNIKKATLRGVDQSWG